MYFVLHFYFPFYILILGPLAKGRLFCFTSSPECGSAAGIRDFTHLSCSKQEKEPTVQQTGFNFVRKMLLHLQVPQHLTRSAFKKVVSFNTFSLSDSVNQLFCYLTIQTN